MKAMLTRFRVTSFRSIVDSGWIGSNDLTCLVVTNESGKTNELKAFAKLKPTGQGSINPLIDFPRSQYHEYKPDGPKTAFFTAGLELEECDLQSYLNPSPEGKGEQRNLRDTVIDKKNIKRYVFTGFQRCMYAVQKFDSDPERKLALILERDAQKWFKPMLGQFQIYYAGADGQKLYQPDFVAETGNAILLLEVKDRSEMNDRTVLAKREAAETWCAQATAYSVAHGGKAWRYRLLAGDGITENMSLEGLVG